MTTEDAKSYLSKKQIPRLFESLMTGLMYHRPTDHIKYLIDCLQKIHDNGENNITWSHFVDIRRTKTPLPPITPENGKRPKSRSKSRQKEPSKIDGSVKSLDDKKASPLPAIGKTGRPAGIPDVPIVFIMGGPGSGKLTQVKMLQKKYPKWVHLSMGDLLRTEITKKGTADDKWDMIGTLVNQGEMAPEEITADLLVQQLKAHSNPDGFIVEGYPRTPQQVKEFEKAVGRIDMAFMLDCDEHNCATRLLKRKAKMNRIDDNAAAIAKRISAFKDNTIPAAKMLDDRGKLIVVDGDNDVGVVNFQLCNMFKLSMYGDKKGIKFVPTPCKIPNPPDSSIPEAASYIRPASKSKSREASRVNLKDVPVMKLPGPPTITVKDEGRKPGLPTCPIIVIAGGPGSGKGTQTKKLVERYKGTVHISMGDVLRNEIATKGSADAKWGMIGTLVQKGEMAPEEVTIDLLKSSISKHKDATAIFLEGFPRDCKQVEEFNKYVGGLNFVVLFDCEEIYLQERLLNRGKASGRIDDNLNAVTSRINFFRNNTLPILKHFDDEGKLVCIYGDRDIDEVFFDLCQVVDFAFFGQKSTGQPTPSAPAEDGKKPVEEEIVAVPATTTGNNEGNPEYSKVLDSAKK